MRLSKPNKYPTQKKEKDDPFNRKRFNHKIHSFIERPTLHNPCLQTILGLLSVTIANDKDAHLKRQGVKHNTDLIVMIEVSTIEREYRLLLTPNRSASWQQTKYLMLGFTLVVLTIAIGWSLIGAWVILPFAGAEVFALVVTMYFVSRNTYRWEQITLTPDAVVIANSRGITVSFERATTYFFFIEDTSNRQLPRLIFKSTSANVEVGTFLNISDKRIFLSHLEGAGMIICKNKWW